MSEAPSKIEAGVLNPAPIIKGASEILNIILNILQFMKMKQILQHHFHFLQKISVEIVRMMEQYLLHLHKLKLLYLIKGQYISLYQE